MKRKLNQHGQPEPAATTFADLHLDPRLLQAIAREKFDVPTPVQLRSIPAALDGKDILIRSKTGSGKTVAYLLPVIHSTLQRKAARLEKSTTALILVPTKELGTQITSAVKTFSTFCAESIRCENVCRKEDDNVTRSRLADSPDIVIATPGRASYWVNSEVLKIRTLHQLVIDEADLVLNYGYEDDLRSIADSLPAGVQTMLISATLRTEVDALTSMFCKSGAPSILDLSEEEAAEQATLSQYIVPTAEDEKFLIIYAIFKLQLIKGKVIVFVADVDRCYRLKLFLEQFGIRSCVLNSELPVNSRLHVVEEFNRGVYDIVIAADENEIVGDEAGTRKRRTEQDEEVDDDQQETEVLLQGQKPGIDESHLLSGGNEDQPKVPGLRTAPKKPRHSRKDREYGVSRGIDFRHVSCVLNFDLPTTAKSYIHRIGRTARAGQTGMALSFFVPKHLYRKHKPTSILQCQNDEKILERIQRKQSDKGAKVEEWQFDMNKLSGFRYRLTDALRAVTRIAVREARTRELRQELINSNKLQRHFEEHPEDLRHLRHDVETHAVRHQAHLRDVPAYLLPAGGQAAIKRDVGFVGLKRDKDTGKSRARMVNKGKGRSRFAKGKGQDPLKRLNASGRGKD